MLHDMEAQAVQEKKDEEVSFSAFKMWCDTTKRQRQESVKESEELMEQQTADIQKAVSDVAQLGDQLAAIDLEVASDKADMKAANEIRAKEKDEYATTHTDYSESIDAVSRAINHLQKNSGDHAQAAMLLQKVADRASTPLSARRAVSSFLQSAAPGDSVGLGVTAPEANAYEFQSSGIIDMLAKLKDKFRDERSTLEKEEMNKKHAYEALAQDLTDQIERSNSGKARKEKTRGQRQEDAASAKGELEATTASRNEDQKYLEDTTTGCQVKSQDFQARQTLRSEELTALRKAIEIISGGAVAGAADSHLPSFALRRSASMSPLQKHAAQFLQDRAQATGSRMLTMIASKVSVDPFTKVKKLIKDMIVRLMEEASEETEHKGWCDTELGTNKIQRESKTEDVNTLAANSDQLNADIQKLTQEIADITTSMHELDVSVQKATELRQVEKEKNAGTLQDAREAQDAVSSALSILKDYYANAAEATALVQDPMDDAPTTFDAPFTGQQTAGNNVVQFLEVISSDFSRLESDTEMAEQQAAADYKKFSNEAEVDRAMKVADIDNKSKLKTRKSGELAQTTKDLKATQEELDAALQYFDKLKPSCVDSGTSYEDRVERRAEEIESLKDALQILAGEDI